MQRLSALWLPVEADGPEMLGDLDGETSEFSGRRCCAIFSMRFRGLASIDRGTLRWSYRGGFPEDIARYERREAAFGVKRRAPGERPGWDRIGLLVLGDRARYDGRVVPGQTVSA